MYFRLRRDAQNWFDKLKGEKGPFTTAFDFYYCCSLAGIASGRNSAPPDGWSSAGDLIDYFPESYKSSRSLVIGLLICAELNRLGVDVVDKKEVQNKLDEIIDPDTPSKLSDEGVTRLNEYASGGYEYLVERLGGKPEYPEDFLLNLLDEIDTAVQSNGEWI